MSNFLAGLEVDALTRIMRPTMVVALALGVVGFGVALYLNSPLGAVGIIVGIAAAILNVRVLGSGVMQVPADQAEQTKVVRRSLRRNSAVRLALITAVAVGMVLIAPPLGIGMMVGLVIFQIAFVVNAGRVILATKIV